MAFVLKKMWETPLFFKGFRTVFLQILSLCIFLSSSCFPEEQSLPHKIYFLHIPKTGGNSLFQFLADHYLEKNVSEKEILAKDVFAAYHEIPSNPHSLNKPLLYSSHQTYFEAYAVFANSEWKIITSLRNPIERVLSNQRYFKLIGHDRSFPDNLMCLCLTKLNPADPSILMEEHLESAKRTLLEDVFFFVILEKFDESLYLLAKKLGWSTPLENIHTNTTKELYQSYAPEMIDEIVRNNSADLELYEFALSLFEKQKQEIDALPDVVQKIQPSCSEVYYTCDQLFEGFGWYRRLLEKLPENSSRWVRYFTNELHGSMTFPPLKEGQDYKLRGHFAFTQRFPFSSLKVFMNNHLLKHSIEIGDYYLVEANIPKEFVDSHTPTTLSFEIDYPLPPVQYNFNIGGGKFWLIEIVPSSD